MHQLYFYSIVATFIFTMSTGQDGSSNRQIMFGNGFMSHTSSNGKVYSMGSDGSGSFMMNSNSKGNVQSMENDGSGSSSISNANPSHFNVEDFTDTHYDPDFSDSNTPNIQVNQAASSGGRGRFPFSDGSTIDVPEQQRRNIQDGDSSSNQQFFANAPQYQSSGNVVTVSGGNGENGADASQGGADGADGADGSIQVQDLGNGRRRRNL